VFYKSRLSLLILKELRYKDKIKRTYSWIILNISKNKVNGFAFKTRNRNLNNINTFKTNTIINTIIVTIITIYNVYKVKDNTSNIVSIASVKYLVILQK
jgi:hypothetical protein